jgi:hypothetical protein
MVAAQAARRFNSPDWYNPKYVGWNDNVIAIL